MQFGFLKAIQPVGKSSDRHIIWECECVCRNKINATSHNLKCGCVKSCGCMTNDMKSKSHIKHGFRKRKTDNRMYSIWVKMKQRCYNENDKAYKDYGGRGITVCEEWLHDFQAFYDWSMKNGYRDDLSIDRKDVNGNYCPENCRWATIKEQVNNTRRNIILEYNGKKQTLSQLSE